MDVAAETEHRARREADSHACPPHLPSLPDHVWRQQGLCRLPARPLQEMPPLSARPFQGREGGSSQGEGAEGQSRPGLQVRSPQEESQGAVFSSHRPLAHWWARSRLQTDPASRSSHLPSLRFRVPRACQGMRHLRPHPLQEMPTRSVRSLCPLFSTG